MYLSKLLISAFLAPSKHQRRHFRSCFGTEFGRFTAGLVSAWLSLQFQARAGRIKFKLPVSSQHASEHNKDGGETLSSFDEKSISQVTNLSGTSVDLTSFAVTRALETIIGDLWSRHRSRRMARAKWTLFESIITRFADAASFAIGSGVVMWAWFYLPDRLPQVYSQWIKRVAQVDQRLIEVLRKARKGSFIYGENAKPEPCLEGMCKDYHWPLIWADPRKTVPVPCEMVHSGSGASCNMHAIVRFVRAFKFAITTYLPVQLLLKSSRLDRHSSWRALQDALRSSTFLGAFVALFYYGVCLCRSVLGSKLVQRKLITWITFDRGLCIRAGCFLCGWSILIEAPKRRQEIASFVAPRALATMFPRQFDSKASSPAERSDISWLIS